MEGHRLPTVEDVALKSGVSLRSIYRYFPDRDELLQAALVRRMEVAEPLFRLDDLGSGPLEERIERFVEHRIELHDTMAPTARAALQAAASAPLIAEVVRRRRYPAHRADPEALRARARRPPRRRRRTTCWPRVDVLCQFEALEALRVERGLSPGAHPARARAGAAGAARTAAWLDRWPVGLLHRPALRMF